MFRKFSLWAMVLREGEGGGGGGAPASGGQAPAGAGGAAPAGGAPAGGGAPGGGQAPAGGAPDPFFRDFLPQHIKGSTPEETFGRLAEEWKAGRDREATRPQPPKTAAEYTFEPSDKIKGYFQDPNDPVMAIARDAALEIGLPKDAFGKFVGKIYEVAAEKGLLAPAYDANAEGRAIAERMGKGWPEGRAEVVKAIQDAQSFGEVLAGQLKLSDGAKALVASLSDEAVGVEILQALSGALGKDPSFRVAGGAAPAGTWTKDSLDKAVADPRYNPSSRQYDKEFRASVDAGFKQLFGQGGPLG